MLGLPYEIVIALVGGAFMGKAMYSALSWLSANNEDFNFEDDFIDFSIYSEKCTCGGANCNCCDDQQD